MHTRKIWYMIHLLFCQCWLGAVWSKKFIWMKALSLLFYLFYSLLLPVKSDSFALSSLFQVLHIGYYLESVWNCFLQSIKIAGILVISSTFKARIFHIAKFSRESDFNWSPYFTTFTDFLGSITFRGCIYFSDWVGIIPAGIFRAKLIEMTLTNPILMVITPHAVVTLISELPNLDLPWKIVKTKQCSIISEVVC